jgi:hypothetical protein
MPVVELLGWIGVVLLLGTVANSLWRLLRRPRGPQHSGDVPDLPRLAAGEQPASSRLRAELVIHPVPRVFQWLQALTIDPGAPSAPPNNPFGRPECEVQIRDLTNDQVLVTYWWGRDIAGAQRHVESLNSRAESTGTLAFAVALGIGRPAT